MTKSDIRPGSFLLTVLLLVAEAAFGQDVQLTQDQLQLLNQLPEEQRQALIERFSQGSGTGFVSRDVTFPELVSPVQSQDADVDTAAEAGEDAELKTFGQDLFEGVPNTFAPATDVPVPPDYVLGPGDTVQVQFYGNENATYSFEVTRDGIINLPKLGPVSVIGLGFDEFRKELENRVANTLIGTNVSVSMGQLRSIRIFVLGDVNTPGSYAVSGLSTMTHALFVSGGISPVGSLRNIQLKRAGKVVEELDLYDLLLQGDTSHDARLMQGDVLFVPTIGKTVSVTGDVKRPAIYELDDEITVGDVLRLSGGLNATAYARGAVLERIASDNKRVVLQVDVSQRTGLAVEVADGDRFSVPQVLDKVFRQVSLKGHVHRPGNYAWSDGMRITDLIGSADMLMQQADVHYALIRREDPQSLQIEVLSTDLQEAWLNPASGKNIPLSSGDEIYIFELAKKESARRKLEEEIASNKAEQTEAAFQDGEDYAEEEPEEEFGRFDVVQRLLVELRAQARSGEPSAEITVTGQVGAVGPYPLESEMRISDALRAAGGLSDRAYAIQAELVRFPVLDGASRESEVIPLDMDRVLRGDLSADILLQAYDRLNIKIIPEWSDEQTVTLEGEFRFPGIYTLRRGETLESVLERAGGLTEHAFLDGTIFLRESLRELEQKSISDATDRLRRDLASLTLEAAASGEGKAAESMAMGNSLLSQLQATEATGRLVLPFDKLNDADAGAELRNLQLQDGDQLLIPRQKFEVTVIGEVQQPTSHLFESGLTRDDYLAKSGGPTAKADKKNIYVVRANGSVVGVNKSRWLGRRGNIELHPGDTIVVPLDADRMRPMAFWTGVTQILYQGAISVAAVKTFRR